MPSTSTLTSSEKALIKKHAPVASSHDKILTAAIARVYYAYPDPAKWAFSGISGALVYGWGSNGGWLKVVDLAGTRGVIWQHEVTEDMQYYQDRTFFHTFPGDECMIGLSYSSESEAAELFKKISLRHKHAKKSGSGSGGSSPTKKSSGTATTKKKKGGGIDKSMIGRPTQFEHVAHMGFDTEKGFSSSNVDPSWERLLGQLESQGISRTQIMKNETFIRNFVEGSGGPPPLPSSPSSAPKVVTSKRIPPPAPPSPATSTAECAESRREGEYARCAPTTPSSSTECAESGGESVSRHDAAATRETAWRVRWRAVRAAATAASASRSQWCVLLL
ncbi:hypothetical protein RQP46_001408 [Phenoliferia psychrophenolica]